MASPGSSGFTSQDLGPIVEQPTTSFTGQGVGLSFAGGNGNDVLSLGDGGGVLFGLGGDDTLTGGAGPDVLIGGDGDDTLAGNAGNDVLLGGNGDDSLNMGSGDDVAFAGSGDDVVRGFAGHDVVFAGDGDDDLQWNDTVGDTVFGGAGEDRIIGADVASDISHGGSGDDFIQAFTTTAANATAGDRLYGDDGYDTVIGGDAADFIEGGTGDDTLTGNGGADIFQFGPDSGYDTVTDFNVAEDVIQLAVVDPAAFGDPLARLSTVDGGTLLDLGDGDTVTLLGVAPEDFSADNFAFGLA